MIIWAGSDRSQSSGDIILELSIPSTPCVNQKQTWQMNQCSAQTVNVNMNIKALIAMGHITCYIDLIFSIPFRQFEISKILIRVQLCCLGLWVFRWSWNLILNPTTRRSPTLCSTDIRVAKQFLPLVTGSFRLEWNTNKYSNITTDMFIPGTPHISGYLF